MKPIQVLVTALITTAICAVLFGYFPQRPCLDVINESHQIMQGQSFSVGGVSYRIVFGDFNDLQVYDVDNGQLVETDNNWSAWLNGKLIFRVIQTGRGHFVILQGDQ